MGGRCGASRAYNSFKNMIASWSDDGTVVGETVQDFLNHEFGHLITRPHSSMPTPIVNKTAYQFFDENFDSLQPLLDGEISDYAWTNAHDALSEIYTAHKMDISLPQPLYDFFNYYSPYYKIE